MKIISIIAVLLMFTNQNHAQLPSGKYQIKLVSSQKVIELYSNSMVLNPICENPLAAACKKQVWELKSVPNRTGVYTISNTENNLLLTHTTESAGTSFSMYVKLLPIKPQSQRDEQYFNIIEKRNPDRTVAGYIFQPYSRSNPTMAKEYYFGARASSMNWDNCPLELFFNNGADTEKISYEPLLFSLEKVSGGVIVGPSRVVSDVVTSPAVIVAPKSDNKLDIDFKTGGDNLDPKDFMEGLKVTVKIKNKPDLVKENANEGREWPNNSIRRVSINLPADVVCSDIHEIVLSRDTKGGTKNNMTAIVGDNWNLDKVTVTTRIKTNGTMKTGTMNWMSPSGSGHPLYRFVYENRDSDVNTGTSLTLQTGSICPSSNTNSTTTSTPTNASLNCVFGTGGDNLEGGSGNNVDIRIKFKSSNNIITLSNVNDTAKWNNFTENTVTKSIPNSATIDINDIKEVEVRHTGGGGMFADNWHVDKIKITITKNGVSRVLVDRVGAPIHMFTGDTRIKRFTVE